MGDHSSTRLPLCLATHSRSLFHTCWPCAKSLCLDASKHLAYSPRPCHLPRTPKGCVPVAIEVPSGVVVGFSHIAFPASSFVHRVRKGSTELYLAIVSASVILARCSFSRAENLSVPRHAVSWKLSSKAPTRSRASTVAATRLPMAIDSPRETCSRSTVPWRGDPFLDPALAVGLHSSKRHHVPRGSHGHARPATSGARTRSRFGGR